MRPRRYQKQAYRCRERRARRLTKERAKTGEAEVVDTQAALRHALDDLARAEVARAAGSTGDFAPGVVTVASDEVFTRR